MTFDNPLDPVWERYLVARASLKVASRALVVPNGPWGRSEFADELPDDAMMRSVQSQLDDWAIVELWGRAERWITERADEALVLDATAGPAELVDGLRRMISFSFERSPFNERIALFRWLLGDKLLGQVRQVKDYRDWLAHYNPGSKPAGRVAPEYAYPVLSAVLKSLHAAW